MKAPEFYEILTSYYDFFKNVGFKKKSKNKLVNDDIELTIILDKWGWDDENGWGFLIRMTDNKGVDKTKYERPRKIYDIRPFILIKEGLLTDDELDELYSQFKESNTKFYEQRKGSWFAFYDEKHLRQMLDNLMPTVVKSVNNWVNVTRQERDSRRI